MTTHGLTSGAPAGRPRLPRTSPITVMVFIALLGVGIFYSFFSLRSDVTEAGPVDTS